MRKQLPRPILVGALIVAMVIATGFIWWRLSIQRHLGYDAILVDPSDSQGLDSACDKVRAIVRQDLSDARMARGGKIALFSMGSEATANEPILKGIFDLPNTSAVMAGESAAETKRRDIESQIVERCKQIVPTTVSPLFGSFKRVVEFLQQQDSDPNAYLVMHAITDGEETQVKEIIKAFDQKLGTKVNLPMVIDNDRVYVEICGMAETIGTVVTNKAQINKTPPRTPQRAARETEVWTNTFSKPIQVKPYCVSVSEQTAQK